MREKEIEKYLTKRVKEIGGKAYKFTSVGNAGMPDRLVCLPNGEVIFVELKAPNGRLSKRQAYQINKLISLKAVVYVLNSKTAVDDFIEICKKGFRAV